MTTTTVREVPVDPALAEKLRRAAGKADKWVAERDALILEARRAGGTAREIGEMVGMTHAGVLYIEKRLGREAERNRTDADGV